MILSGLRGTLQNVFRIGQVLLKNSSGVLHVRDSGDTSDAAIHAGSITLTTGASDGYVLTSDASGNASWKASQSGAGAVNRVISTNTTIQSPYSFVVSGYIEIDDGVVLYIDNGAEVYIA
jgi:hypothetical protein